MNALTHKLDHYADLRLCHDPKVGIEEKDRDMEFDLLRIQLHGMNKKLEDLSRVVTSLKTNIHQNELLDLLENDLTNTREGSAKWTV